jgi:hypothetical protein
MEGLVGSFQFSNSVGSFPLVALVFCVIILATCVLGGIGMGTAGGALAPALGWFIVTLVMTLPTSAGSVIVTNTTAGQLYLYGGALCAAAGVVVAFVRRVRTAAPRPPAPPLRSAGPRSPRDPAADGPRSPRGPASDRPRS